MARRKTSIAFDENIAKMVRKRGIDKGLGFARALEAAGSMWAGPHADAHEDLEWVLGMGPVASQQELKTLLSELVMDRK